MENMKSLLVQNGFAPRGKKEPNIERLYQMDGITIKKEAVLFFSSPETKIEPLVIFIRDYYYGELIENTPFYSVTELKKKFS